MSNEVPTRSRDIVVTREQGRCLRCGGPGAQWCHRRRRNVADGHQHCPCNGWYGCPTCHAWAHAHPAAAEERGFAVSSYETEPGRFPVGTWYGPLYLECDGDIRFDIQTGATA